MAHVPNYVLGAACHCEQTDTSQVSSSLQHLSPLKEQLSGCQVWAQANDSLHAMLCRGQKNAKKSPLPSSIDVSSLTLNSVFFVMTSSTFSGPCKTICTSINAPAIQDNQHPSFGQSSQIRGLALVLCLELLKNHRVSPQSCPALSEAG